MARPLEMALRLGWYILKNKARRRRRFPLVTMLEPLEACNLACEGCGRIREYEAVIDRTVSLEKCLSAVEESGAPIVSIAGGEPTLHPQIHDIVNGITARKKFVYMCTNALLMDRVMRNIPALQVLLLCRTPRRNGGGARQVRVPKGRLQDGDQGHRDRAGQGLQGSRPTRQSSTGATRTT